MHHHIHSIHYRTVEVVALFVLFGLGVCLVEIGLLIAKMRESRKKTFKGW